MQFIEHTWIDEQLYRVVMHEYIILMSSYIERSDIRACNEVDVLIDYYYQPCHYVKLRGGDMGSACLFWSMDRRSDVNRRRFRTRIPSKSILFLHAFIYFSEICITFCANLAKRNQQLILFGKKSNFFANLYFIRWLLHALDLLSKIVS